MDLSYADFPAIIKNGGYNGYSASGESAPSTPVPSIDQLAKDVIAGKYGNGDARKSAITALGADYNAVQARVNELLSASFPAPAKSVEEIAKEVISGAWGNGEDRRARLDAAGYDYAAVQATVNELCGASSPVYYTVQSGDTLSAIAGRYGTSVEAIQRLNPDRIRNVNVIEVGWRIRVK